MKFALIALFAVLACVAVADRKILSESNQYFNPDVWMSNGDVRENELVVFGLFLRQRNLDVLNEMYEDRVNPNSENWRQWVDIDTLNDLVKPLDSDRRLVFAWLKENGVRVHEIVDNADALHIATGAAVVEKLFQTELFAFKNNKGKEVVKVMGEYSIPEGLSHVIDFVTGLEVFEVPDRARLRAHNRVPSDLPGDDEKGKVVPYTINQVYGVPDTWTYNSNSSLCLAEFQNDRAFIPTDLASFQSQNDLPNNPVNKTVGPFNDSFPDAESTLDVEFGSGQAVNAPVWFWVVDGWMLEFANAFYNTAQVPYVVSMSWGWTETNQCQITSCNGLTSEQYVDRVNVEFQKIGLRGVSLVASSGDQGAPGDDNPYCLNNADPISSIFPGASPYVLSIGATALNPTSELSEPQANEPPVCSTTDCADPSWPEIVCTYPTALITTGGGFSAYSPVPSWQQSNVQGYLNSGVALPDSKYFNSSNRGFPDVSALGHNYYIYINGRNEIVDGTSCSAPVWGGMISLWNDMLLNAGQNTMGPLASFIYDTYNSDQTTFNDISTGDNKCTESRCCDMGYESAKGWDPVTGLGSPNFATITNYIKTSAGI